MNSAVVVHIDAFYSCATAGADSSAAADDAAAAASLLLYSLSLLLLIAIAVKCCRAVTVGYSDGPHVGAGPTIVSSEGPVKSIAVIRDLLAAAVPALGEDTRCGVDLHRLFVHSSKRSPMLIT